MNIQDKVEKAIWYLIQGIKDQVGRNIASASASKKIKVEPNVLAQLLSLIDQSIDQAYHNGLKLVVSEVNALATTPVESKKKRS